MKFLRKFLTAVALIGALGGMAPALASEDIVLIGDKKCTACHDEGDSPVVMLIGKTKHGTNADGRTPTCTSCHGPSETHLAKAGKGPGETPMPDIIYSAKTKVSAEDRSNACLKCHQKDAKRSHWEGSTHQTHDVTCASCHKIHSGTDKVRDKLTQPEVCFTCHKEQRIQANKPSHHPILEGKVACSDCHNPHGSVGPKLMKRDSIVETCYTCHMEKRGPFVHSHEPVDEDCTNCHNPHGTTAESLLKARPPFLCNECHTPHAPIQPSLAGQTAAPNSVGWWNPSAITQGRACLNCHTQIHGSNNPSAANPPSQRFFR